VEKETMVAATLTGSRDGCNNGDGGSGEDSGGDDGSCTDGNGNTADGSGGNGNRLWW
jgi:hypothetical protein